MVFYENSTAFLILVNPKLLFLMNLNRKKSYHNTNYGNCIFG